MDKEKPIKTDEQLFKENYLCQSILCRIYEHKFPRIGKPCLTCGADYWHVQEAIQHLENLNF